MNPLEIDQSIAENATKNVDDINQYFRIFYSAQLYNIIIG